MRGAEGIFILFSFFRMCFGSFSFLFMEIFLDRVSWNSSIFLIVKRCLVIKEIGEILGRRLYFFYVVKYITKVNIRVGRRLRLAYRKVEFAVGRRVGDES